jgi:hypothetical protein
MHYKKGKTIHRRERPRPGVRLKKQQQKKKTQPKLPNEPDLIDERYGYGSGTRRRTRPDQAPLFHPAAIRRPIEIAATASPKRQTKAGDHDLQNEPNLTPARTGAY